VRPPFPARKGLWGKPTNVNNVETLANIPGIIEHGGDRYAATGIGKSTGTKLFSLSGSIVRSGVFEVPFGSTLRELVEGLGGVPDGRRLKALQPGGAMLGLVPVGLIDTPIDFEALDKLGSGVGSGGMVAIDESACMVDIARSLMEFACDEACGKCLPGMLGTNQMLEILNDITSGNGQPQDPELLAELGKSMVNAAFCPLCGGASAPLLSTIRHFGDEYQAHISERRCPAGACPMPALQE
jgi:NADH:ubiquinone oxidoreductase subunit F (NADH-binding)